MTGAYDGNVLDIWDASDCRDPKLMASYDVTVQRPQRHALLDARTLYYATALPTSETNQPAPNVVAIDLADLANPRVVHQFALSDLVAQGQGPAPLGVHNVEISPDGTRMYAGIITPGLLAPLLTEYTRGRGEMTILDVSDIQNRAATPKVRFISQFDNSLARAASGSARGGRDVPRLRRRGGQQHRAGDRPAAGRSRGSPTSPTRRRRSRSPTSRSRSTAPSTAPRRWRTTSSTRRTTPTSTTSATPRSACSRCTTPGCGSSTCATRPSRRRSGTSTRAADLDTKFGGDLRHA